MADTKISALTADTSPTVDDLVVTVDSPGGTPVNKKVTLGALLALAGYPCQGRLTLESGVPVSTTDQTGKTTIYFTPYNGNTVALYTSSAWTLYTFTEKSLALGTLTSGKNYDVFLYDNAGTLTLELSAAWTNDTTRADAIAQQDGIDVKSSDHSRRLVGAIRTTGTTTTEDSAAKRFICNRYNRERRTMGVIETADSWSYTTGSYRQANANAANQLAYLDCIGTIAVDAIVFGHHFSTSGPAVSVGIGLDSTTVSSAQIHHGINMSNAPSLPRARYGGTPGLGYHFLAWLELGGTGSSWFGDNANPTIYQSGIQGTIWN